MSYSRFFAMIATSTIVMFALMYLNTYLLSHIFFSETRAYMAILMGAAMAIVMLGFMFSMYPNKTANITIFACSALVFATALWLVRSQITVGEVSYMRAMIPHHSIAIMTSERADISDPRVRKLADEIISAQEKEIAEMKYLIADLSDGEGPSTPEGESRAEFATVSEALDRPEISTLDAQAMTLEEVAAGLPRGSDCVFLRTLDSPAILAISRDGTTGVMKLSGQLIKLTAAGSSTREAPRMAANGLRMRVLPVAEAQADETDGRSRTAADLLFDLDAGLTVGYRGFLTCAGAG